MGTSPDEDEDEEYWIEPAELYHHIESWWGADFDDELIDRIVKAPWEHLEAFAESVYDLKDRIAGTANEIPLGFLRPAVVNNFGIDIPRRIDALKLLLYAHEILLDKDDLFIDFSPLKNPPDFLAVALKQIKAMRPFVEDGSIKFASVESIFRHPAYGGEYERVMMQAGEILAQVEEERIKLDSLIPDPWDELSGKPWRELSEENKRLDIYRSRYGHISAACSLAASHRAHTLARNRLDEEVVRAYLQRPVTDNRQVNLQKLAALHVPTIMGIDNVVALRKSSADFAEWRTRLGQALTYVGELGEDDESVDEAAEVVYAQLSDGLMQVEKGIEKSPALRAVRGGLAGFAINGISAMTTELLLGNPSIGLVAAASAAGAGAGMVLDSGLSYLKALQERRNGHLILDVSMMFDPYGDSMPRQLAQLSQPIE
jgi:hypothetical protein